MFCAREGKSREHVIPRQLDRLLKQSRPVPIGKQRIGLKHQYTPPSGSDARALEWATRGPDLVTTEVCAVCNSGWLATLESRAMPVLNAAVLGDKMDLRSDDQIAAAAWCYRTVLLMQLVRPDARFQIIPRLRYAQFGRERRPPADVRVWLGAMTPSERVVHAATEKAPLNTLTSELAGYFSLLTVGHLVILCSGRAAESEEPLYFDARAEGRALVRVWPASMRTRCWPPPEAIRDLRLEALASLI